MSINQATSNNAPFLSAGCTSNVAGATASRLRLARATLRFAGELLTSPAILLADLFHRERTLTRRTLIAYLVLLALASALSLGIVADYRLQVEQAWTVLGGYGEAATELPQLTFANEIRLAAAEQQLDPALLASMIIVESSLRPEVVSRAGARGLMQLLPATWRSLRPNSVCDGEHQAPACGEDCIFAPLANIRAGASYLRTMLDEFDGNFVAAFAAYNAGAPAVRQVAAEALSIPPYPETEQYVGQILARWSALRALDGEHSPVARLAQPGQISFAVLGVSAGLWLILIGWAIIKGRQTGHPDALV